MRSVANIKLADEQSGVPDATNIIEANANRNEKSKANYLNLLLALAIYMFENL